MHPQVFAPHPVTGSAARAFSEFPEHSPVHLGPLQARFQPGDARHTSHAHDTAVWERLKGSKTLKLAHVTCDDGNQYWAAETASGWRVDHRRPSL